MDLSFPLPDRAVASELSAAESAALAALLAPSPAAATRAAGSLLAPAHGCFNDAMAARLACWRRS